MAHNVNGATLTPIYERLNGVANYHPLDAETFGDWSMEAGDIVEVTRDGKSYSSPVHTSSITWRGRAPVMAINTTGNQKRDPVAKVAKRKYGGSGASMRNDQYFISELTSEDGTLHSLIYQTTTYIMTAVDDTASDLHTQIVETAGMIESSVATAQSQMYTVIRQTSTEIFNGVYNDLSGDFATIVQTSTMIATSVNSARSSLYSTIQQTSTSIMTEVVKKNRIFVQLTDPALTVPDLHDGDVWVQSSGIRTWNQVAQKVWSAIGDLAWRQLYGSVWFLRKNGAWEKHMDEAAVVEQKVRIEQDEEHYAIVARELDSQGNTLNARINVTASEIRSEVNTSKSQIYSQISQTATNIMSTVVDVQGDLSTMIEQTASEIVSTASAARSTLYSVIQQTATSVFSGVYDKVSNNFSTIVQTSTMIATAVVSANSSLYSTIAQTSTNIMTEVGKKNRVFIQFTDPALTVSDLHDGDIWVQSSGIRTWNQVAQNSWSSVGDKLWRQLYGSVWYVRKNGAWEKNVDESSIVEQRVRIEHNEESYSILGHQLDTLGQSMDTKLQVTASKIESTASAARSTLYSVIRQTATNIMSTVANVQNDLSTQIEQTASQIESTASAARSTLYSVIRQTATNIMSTVANTRSDVFTQIEQTASQIRSEVNASKSTIWSSITQTSTQISLKVGKGEVISSINQTAESVTIDASKINLNGYVKATDLTASYIAGILVNSSVLSTNYMFTKSLEIGTGGATINGYSCALEDGIKALQITQDGNTYTLQKKHFYSSDWSTVGTFSRATSLSGEWSGTVAAGKSYKVTASPQGDVHYSPQLDGISRRDDKTWASDKKSFTQTLYAYDEDGTEIVEDNMTFYTTDSYNAGHTAGWADAWGEVHAPSAGTNTTFSVSVPSSTEDTGATMDFTITKGATPSSSGYAAVSCSWTNGAVGRIPIGDWYTAGYEANHSMFIGDADCVAKPSSITLSPGESIEVWAYFKNLDDETYQWSPKYTIAAQSLSWSYGTLAKTNSIPSSYAKKYEVDTSYRYWYFNVTVNGVSKRILIDVLGV